MLESTKRGSSMLCVTSCTEMSSVLCQLELGGIQQSVNLLCRRSRLYRKQDVVLACMLEKDVGETS